MKAQNIINLSISIIICEFAGVIGSIFTFPAIGAWYKNLNKPVFNPPSWIFGPVWTFLFLLMGISFYLVWKEKWVVKNKIGIANKKSWNVLSTKLWEGDWQKVNIITIFFVQLVLNICWSIIFFGARSPAVAFFELLALWFAILFTIINFYRVSKTAAYLLMPYILWVSFAGVLNFVLWIIN